jgi:hypothetical protein
MSSVLDLRDMVPWDEKASINRVACDIVDIYGEVGKYYIVDLIKFRFRGTDVEVEPRTLLTSDRVEIAIFMAGARA